MFKIEEGIPLPKINDVELTKSGPFYELQIGQSVALIGDNRYKWIFDSADKRNNDGTDRFFEAAYIEDPNSESGRIIRLWCISYKTYIKRGGIGDADCLQFLVELLSSKKMLKTDIIRFKSDDPRAGSQTLRGKVLKKYAFMFNIKTQQKRGGGYEYSLK